MYKKEFKLKPQELELIESALRGRLSRRAQSRLQHVESTIQDASQLDSVKKIDAEIKEINELLAKFHQQKNWYRSPDEIYVSG